jgi:hypothetical protein
MMFVAPGLSVSPGPRPAPLFVHRTTAKLYFAVNLHQSIFLPNLVNGA